MPYRYNVKIDFIGNWIHRLRKELEEQGYNTKNIKDEDISFDYFNLKRREVIATPRKVLISKEFQCPKKLEGGLDILKKKIEDGEDISRHLSKGILDLNCHDGLLNDWGIHHLHLGTDIDKKTGFINRTGPLLYVRFDTENAYLINVYQHGAWTEKAMIKIIHDNWSESIKKFRLNGVVALSNSISNEQHKQLRGANVVVFVEVEPGVVYAPIGMGYATSGHSTEAMKTSNYYVKILRKYEEYVRGNISQIAKHLEKKGVNVGYNLSFHLWLENNRVIAYEQYSNSFIELGLLSNA